MSMPILSLITFLPIIGVILILSIDSKKQELIRITSLLVSIGVFFISVPLYFNFDALCIRDAVCRKTAVDSFLWN